MDLLEVTANIGEGFAVLAGQFDDVGFVSQSTGRQLQFDERNEGAEFQSPACCAH